MTPDEIREALQTLGLNQAAAAPLLGYGDPSRVSDIVTGKSKPHGAVPLLLRAYLDGYRPDGWPDEAARPLRLVKGDG